MGNQRGATDETDSQGGGRGKWGTQHEHQAQRLTGRTSMRSPEDNPGDSET